MDFELRQTNQEFKIQENGTVTFGGTVGWEYARFYKKLAEGEGSPEEFVSIFDSFIEDCGFNLQDQKPVIDGGTIFLRELKDTLSTIEPTFSDDDIDKPRTIPPLGGFNWVINSNLNFVCHPDAVITQCLISIGGAGGVKRERTDDLMRLAILSYYPGIIEVTSVDKGYLINIGNYAYLKTILTLLTQTLSSPMNEIIMSISSVIGNLIQNVKDGKVEKKFLDNLI